METINGCTVVPPSEAPEPVSFGPAETQRPYVLIAGAFPPGQQPPPLHVRPHTDEAFYIADGEATFQLGDREVPATAGCRVSCPERCPTPSGTRATDRCAGSSSSRPATRSICSFPSRPRHRVGR
jgi:cupin domain